MTAIIVIVSIVVLNVSTFKSNKNARLEKNQIAKADAPVKVANKSPN